MNGLSKLFGGTGALTAIILSWIFLFYNPYSELKPSQSTIYIVAISLVIPSILVIFACVIGNKRLMLIGMLLSFPYSIYFGVSNIPSIWNLYLLALVFYAISFILHQYKKAAVQ